MVDGKYADTAIVKLRNFQRKLVSKFDLETDAVLIHGELVLFKLRQLFDGKAIMLLPSHFTEMPAELLKLRYLSHQSPQLILTGNNLNENICISCIERKGRDLAAAVDIMRNAIRQSAPDTVFYESGEITAKNCEGRWFEYKSFTLTDEAYNIQFLIGTENMLLHGVFNCSIRDFEQWKKYIIKALEYTEIVEQVYRGAV